MNEILTINYESENPTVSAFDIWEVLDRCEDFTQFFIALNSMKSEKYLKMVFFFTRSCYKEEKKKET